MVPIAVLLLLQVPPDGVSVIGVHWPSHTAVAPLIAPGRPLTVTTCVRTHPLAVLVNTIVVVPAAIPVTTPTVFTVPTALVLLDHEPPGVAEEVSVVVFPAHITIGPPPITAGSASTVTTEVVIQPVPSE